MLVVQLIYCTAHLMHFIALKQITISIDSTTQNMYKLPFFLLANKLYLLSYDVLCEKKKKV